jgi:gp45 sliding clamp, C terminal
MKLSNETLNVLKNFSGINQGIEFKKGNKLSTISAGKTVLAQATIKDEFPQDFCVYDLNQFLSVHSLFKSGVELEFDDSNVTFKGDRSKIKYRMTAKNMIVTPPDKSINLNHIDCSFSLTELDLAEIMRAASVLSSPHIAVQSDGETINIVTFDANDDSQHTNSIHVSGVGNGKQYSVVFKTENFKMIPGAYDVEISFKGLGHFKNTKEDIQYWIAFESKESKV